MHSPILYSIKNYFPKFFKKMKWWLLVFFLLFGMNSLRWSEGDFVIFLYKFLPSFFGSLIALIIVYYFKYGGK